jgi:hypothetical protein
MKLFGESCSAKFEGQVMMMTAIHKICNRVPAMFRYLDDEMVSIFSMRPDAFRGEAFTLRCPSTRSPHDIEQCLMYDDLLKEKTHSLDVMQRKVNWTLGIWRASENTCSVLIVSSYNVRAWLDSARESVAIHCYA